MWPDLAITFRLYPDDVPRFSPQEWRRFIDRLEDMNHQRG